MTVLIDTNVILDVLLQRHEFLQASSGVILLSERSIVEGYVTASAVTDIFYITNNTYKDKRKTTRLIKDVLKTVNVAAVSGEEIHRALELDWDDFEDAVQYTTGEHIQADYIITRDPSGYGDSSIPVIQPADFLTLMEQ